MKFIFIVFLFLSTFSLAQLPAEEIELIKKYKQSLINKSEIESIQSLKDLIVYHKEQTYYHLALGFIYQLQRSKKLSSYHLKKGKEFVIEQLVTKELSPKETMDHVVALCFAGFPKECEEMFIFSESRFIADEYFKDFDFDTVKELAENQRNTMKNYFDK